MKVRSELEVTGDLLSCGQIDSHRRGGTQPQRGGQLRGATAAGRFEVSQRH